MEKSAQQTKVPTKQAPLQPAPSATHAPTEKKKQPKSKAIKLSILLGIISVLLLGGIVFLLSRLPVKAGELRDLRSAEIIAAAGGNSEILEAEVVGNTQKTEELAALFPDDTKIVRFVEELDKLKSEGVVTDYSFGTNSPVPDRTKLLGLTISVTFQGSPAEVSAAVEKFQALPYMVRAESVIVDNLDGVTTLNYGAILYVASNLN